MFYSANPDTTNLRFGDVIQGFATVIPEINVPFKKENPYEFSFQIESNISEFYVIMTPCCTIGVQTISMVPIERIQSNYFRNPEIINDFTKLNIPIDRELVYPPMEWYKLSEDRKNEEKAKGKSYEFLDYFFFEGGDMFSDYQVEVNDVIYTSNFMMVDFKKIFKVKCKHIKRNSISDEILELKQRELSIITRKQLRDKIVNYFGREPEEDFID